MAVRPPDFPDLFPASRRGPIGAKCHRKSWAGWLKQGKEKPPLCKGGDSMAKPCRGDCEAKQMIQLSAVAQCGSTAWERRRAANPPGGASRHPPLHKGGVFAWVCSTGLSYIKSLPDGRLFCYALGQDCILVLSGGAGAPGPDSASSRGEYGCSVTLLRT